MESRLRQNNYSFIECTESMLALKSSPTLISGLRQYFLSLLRNSLASLNKMMAYSHLLPSKLRCNTATPSFSNSTCKAMSLPVPVITSEIYHLVDSLLLFPYSSIFDYYYFVHYILISNPICAGSPPLAYRLMIASQQPYGVRQVRSRIMWLPC